MKNPHEKSARKMPVEMPGGDAEAEALRRMGTASAAAGLSLQKLSVRTGHAQQAMVKLGAAMRKVQPDVTVAQAAIQGVKRASDSMLEALQRDRERRAAWQSMTR